MSGKSSFGDFLTGVIIGGAVGYVFALLNAPRPGDETRQMWTDRSRELRERAMDTVQTTVDKTGKLVNEGRDRLGTRVEDTRNRMQERVSDLKGRSDSTLTNVRSQVSDSLHKVADQVDPNETPDIGMPSGPEI